jgi:hypothetical protein
MVPWDRYIGRFEIGPLPAFVRHTWYQIRGARSESWTKRLHQHGDKSTSQIATSCTHLHIECHMLEYLYVCEPVRVAVCVCICVCVCV